MSRMMIDANRKVFSRLAAYCADRGDPVKGDHLARWIWLDQEGQEHLKGVKLLRSMSFGRHRHLAQLEYQGASLLALVGFDHEPLWGELLPLESVDGYSLAILSELPVMPIAPPSQIRNIVEAGSDREAAYKGHHSAGVLELFPNVQVHEVRSTQLDSMLWALFLEFCIAEVEWGISWIQEPLSGSLNALAALNVPSLPYRELCRAVFDLDPRSLYMVLYRCLEATYAYEKATALSDALSVKLPWNSVASLLKDRVGWRPRELSSLEQVLAHANEDDLNEICHSLGVETGDDLRRTASRAIYRVRNTIVHYQPAGEGADLDDIDWNRACNALVTTALDVFSKAYV